MNQTERRIYLINELLRERRSGPDMEIPGGEQEQKQLLRSLFNVRMPLNADEEFLKIQDEYLKEETAKKGITDIDELEPVKDNIYLWQGDITTLRCNAIVNAANSRMLGCFVPCHGCIDNAIHTYAGVQLRLACHELMKSRGEEPTGEAEITPAYNLPCRYVLHTVGPIVTGRLTQNNKNQLASCYRECLMLAESNGIDSIAFCCISTGEFCFPNDKAAEIAVNTVTNYISETNSEIKVIFNVFKDIDYKIYKSLLSAD